MDPPGGLIVSPREVVVPRVGNHAASVVAKPIVGVESEVEVVEVKATG
jgi:hypothetical protein